jgi:Domain of unknown function (DUF4347)
MTRHLAAIDAVLPHTQALLAGLPEGTQVAWIDPRQDGLAALAARLESAGGLTDVVHVLSHGAPGVLSLGAALYCVDTLGAHAATLARIRACLADDAELRLYGCELAAGASGVALVDALADALGATVSAASQVIGLTVDGASWTLDVATGPVRSAALLDHAGAVHRLAGQRHLPRRRGHRHDDRRPGQ